MDRPAGSARGLRHLASAARVLATAAALIDLVVLFGVLAVGRFSLRLGPLRLRSSDGLRLALVSVAIWAVVAAVWWRFRRLRRLSIGALVMVAALGVVLFARQAPYVLPVGDIAVTESYTLLATQGRLLLGPYSRFIWHHPGPLYFLLAAPFYALAGLVPPGVHVGALAINILSLLTCVWVARRLLPSMLSFALAAAVALYAWRLGDLLVSVWNPHVTILPAMTLLPLSVAVAAGDVWLLPLVAVFGSFIAQTHVGFVPYALTLSAAAVAGVLVTGYEPGSALDVRTRRVLNVTAWVIAALWLLPIAEEVTHTPGNLTRLWQFFVHDQRPGQAVRDAFVAWAESTAAPIGAMKPGWGVAFQATGGWLALVVAIIECTLVAATTVWAAITRRRIIATFGAFWLMASMVTLWSITRIAGEIVDHEVFWITGFGMLAVAQLLAALLEVLRGRLAPRWHVPRRVLALVLWLPVVIGVPLGVYQLSSPRGFPFERRTEDRQVRTLYEGIRSYLRNDGVSKPLFRMDFRTWGMTAGVLLQLQRAGVSLAVEGAAVPIFSEVFAPTGDEDAEITIALTPRHLELAGRPGNRLIASSDRYYADVVRIEPNRNR